MEERGNKTIMCSVLFLDIVEYSKKSVSGQISLKDRFNSYLSTAIRDVPMTDRIILDTGDGAAINFLGDVEDALKAALSLRESLLNESPDMDPPLLIRMGINLGPVRLVRDINGQPNIVGDGINVAQRVMGFADASQILVSRSYYDAVSRLSPQYAEMFHYQGSRTDKHVREHEVYAIGYPGDQTSLRIENEQPVPEPGKNWMAVALGRAGSTWNSVAARLYDVIQNLNARYKEAEPKQRALYAAAIGVPLVLLIALTVMLKHRDVAPVAPVAPVAAPAAVPAHAASVARPVSSVSAATPVPAPVKEAVAVEAAPAPSKPGAKKVVESKVAKDKVKHPEQPKAKARDVEPGRAPAADKKEGSAEQSAEAYISVSCSNGSQLFVDGAQKGKITSGSITATVVPGKHTVIVSHPSQGVFSQNVELDSGKTARIRPGFCN